MAESAKHMNYVRRMVDYLPSITHSFINGCVCADLPEHGQQSPKVCGGFYPDVYYRSQEEIIIGEAKTDNDIENEHTKQQIDSYIEEVNSFSGRKVIVLCSSVLSFSLLKNTIIRKKRVENIDNIEFHILDNYKRVAVL